MADWYDSRQIPPLRFGFLKLEAHAIHRDDSNAGIEDRTTWLSHNYANSLWHIALNAR